MKIPPPRNQTTLSLFDACPARPNDNASQIRVWIDPEEPFADNFAGGGGVRVAINWAVEDADYDDLVYLTSVVPAMVEEIRVSRRSPLETLAHNVAVAGALCRAFDLGQRFEEPFPLGPRDQYPPWFPGCGRSLESVCCTLNHLAPGESALIRHSFEASGRAWAE